MDNFLKWLSHWLPLIQGFAAIISIGGAALSWKYALKAQRSQEQMTQNLVTSRLLDDFNLLLNELNEFRSTAIFPKGGYDLAAYQQKEQYHKRILEKAAALAKAATPYLKKEPEQWEGVRENLGKAALNPNPENIEFVCKYLNIANAELELATMARTFGPNI